MRGQSLSAQFHTDTRNQTTVQLHAKQYIFTRKVSLWKLITGNIQEQGQLEQTASRKHLMLWNQFLWTN